MSDEVAEWCGYTSKWDMLNDHMDKAELWDLLMDFVNEDTDGWVSDIIKDIAKDKHDWIDHEQIRADYEDMKYQEWKDSRYDERLGDE